MKIRNKLVDYLSDWTMGKAQMHQLVLQATASGAVGGTLGTVTALTASSTSAGNQPDLDVLSRELDLACMQAIAALLQGLPLQPEENDRGDLMEAKSRLFAKYKYICSCFRIMSLCPIHSNLLDFRMVLSRNFTNYEGDFGSLISM